MSEIIERVKQTLKEGLEQIDKIAIKHNIEIWKPIDGYPNYAVSSLGNVINVVTGKTLKLGLIIYGYYVVVLCGNRNKKTFKVHRLVAIAFISNPENKLCVDHIDNDKTNNLVKNLRFATNKENGQNRVMNRNTTSGVKGVSWDKKNKKWYSKIKINGKSLYIGRYETIEEATTARQLKAKEIFGEFMNVCEQ